jgi:hypothetical protein
MRFKRPAARSQTLDLVVVSTSVNIEKPYKSVGFWAGRYSSSSAGRRIGSENRQLIRESTLVGGPRFCAGDIAGEVRIFGEQTRCLQPNQHRHHHQVARAECAIEPVGTAQASGKFAQPVADAILDEGQALLVPAPVALHDPGDYKIKDRRFHRIERGKHPGDRARPGIRILGQKARMVLCDMEDDCPRLEQYEIAFFIGRNLPERMQRSMRGFLHLTEGNQTNLVRLTHFFKRPANAHVPRPSLAAIRRAFKGGDGGDYWQTNGDFSPITYSTFERGPNRHP